jgi:hypothetical protein
MTQRLQSSCNPVGPCGFRVREKGAIKGWITRVIGRAMPYARQHPGDWLQFRDRELPRTGGHRAPLRYATNATRGRPGSTTERAR